MKSQLKLAGHHISTSFLFRVLGIGDIESTREISTFFVQMGQFIDHDLTLTPETPDAPDCCKRNGAGKLWVFNENFDMDSCIPIRIPVEDPVWRRRKRTCYEVRRSAVALNIPDCEAKREREQFNALTHFLDMSNVYGSTTKEARDVRDGMLLKEDAESRSRDSGRPHLPHLPACSQQINNNNACEGICKQRGRRCKVAGDHRVNEQMGLTSHHTLWLREHNRLATKLESLNTHWDSDRVFQETRRIVVAQWQHIIYSEWLPLLLGRTYMSTFGLLPQTRGYSSSYNEGLDPRINNEFATAAFRCGVWDGTSFKIQVPGLVLQLSD